ncbi:LOW QUALITY PROTEIN: hypothetical protein U9M48_010119 [Paspalum notatum var. saurae]|uniref:F-box domain-containing protein n=1 Tax=Paspalum notatum var. saurae TaxID=547442 RepID=A0AAQ3WFT2_PASNO
MRISFSSDKYHVIKPPMGIEMESHARFYLGKSVKGVYCASIKERCGVQVWSLNESGRNMEWVLKHDKNLSKWLLKHNFEDKVVNGPWKFQDINYYYENDNHHEHNGVSMEAPVEQELECCSEASVDDEKFAWSSDEDRCYSGYMDILGFHPFKEIIFLGESISRGFAYQWNSSKTDMLALLPDDVLAGVLRRLAPRDLAVSRSVCKAWRAAVDDHSSLRATAELLPLSLLGFFINYQWRDISELFSRPSGSGGKRNDDFLAEAEMGSWSTTTATASCSSMATPCTNPATRWRAPVPRAPALPAGRIRSCKDDACYLVYHPAVSPHYHTLSIPGFCHHHHHDSSCRARREEADDGPATDEQSEWPPATCILQVFSSVTGRWEERSFARVGEAAGITVADMRRYRYWAHDQRSAAYRRGQLYIHCQADFIMRISLSDGMYHVIKPPAGASNFYVAKSEKGVYCASGQFRLQVWILNENESSSSMEWMLKHDQDLVPLLEKKGLRDPYYSRGGQIRGSWLLQDINYHYREGVYMRALVKKGSVEWSSDISDDDETSDSSVDNDADYGHLDYKEIIFLSQSIKRGLAYHLNSSTVQELGNLYPQNYGQELVNEQDIQSSFPYTPCWMEIIDNR